MLLAEKGPGRDFNRGSPSWSERLAILLAAALSTLSAMLATLAALLTALSGLLLLLAWLLLSAATLLLTALAALLVLAALAALLVGILICHIGSSSLIRAGESPHVSTERPH